MKRLKRDVKIFLRITCDGDEFQMGRVEDGVEIAAAAWDDIAVRRRYIRYCNALKQAGVDMFRG